MLFSNLVMLELVHIQSSLSTLISIQALAKYSLTAKAFGLCRQKDLYTLGVAPQETQLLEG